MKLAVLAGLSVLLVAVSAATAAPPPHWTPALRWHYDASTPTRFLFMRQLGSITVDTKDDTQQITFDTYGLHVVTHTAAWKTINLKRWLPASAKAVRLSFQTVISRSPVAGNAVVYAFARTPGSGCCVGPPGYRDFPTDYSYQGNIWHEGEVAHGVVVEQDGELREWSTADIVLKARQFQFSWGYRKMPDDAVGLGVYLVAYAD